MALSDNQDTDEVWDLLDALEHFNSKLNVEELNDDEMASLEEALAYDPSSSPRPTSSRASSDVLEYSSAEVPHFPPLSERMMEDVKRGEARTSEPISKGIKHNEEKALVDMASKGRFQELLRTHMGLIRFEEWIKEEGLPGSLQLFKYYKDLRAYGALYDEVNAIGTGMQELYLGQEVNGEQRISSCLPKDHLRTLASTSLSLHTAQEEATERLYATEFRRFVTGKITEQARARLQFIPDHQKRGDLGEVFCIADPRLPDQPLVYISDGFCRLSEYSRDLLIGRNCRFLQGPQTDKGSVQALRDAIAVGREHCCLLLNYTRTGKPFWNLLNMIPLRGVNGAVELLLGAQIDVTAAISGAKAFKNLEDLVGAKDGKNQVVNTLDFSDELIGHAERHLSNPSVARQLRRIFEESPVNAPATPLLSYPGPNSVTRKQSTVSPQMSSPKIPSQKKSSWLSKLKQKGDVPIVMDSRTVPSGRDAKIQAIPAKIRDRMTNFTAAHSKLIVFDAKCGRIQYVTPPLMAYLRYPIRSHKDRLASSLLRMDIVDLLTGETPNETTTIVSSVKNIVATESTQSVFAGLLLSPSGRDAPDHIADAVTDDGKRYARSLLHLTPVKDRRDKSQLYIVVVG
ncbi:hypothetical protein I302_108561 [Kwoniella bestiolae CBS 10118]|uniref:PAS domain-containing protein n=1 Tax=Kwoniella bestiolae CBS 10118 TaxID=1296100 RepID=A0A1B9FVD1_9TREE|nr:hypothetical protein I302_07066 [Kwoniella bestiolae CBS 10118]OCF22726.1 hypothetical protein I302_07066 [Kwoniella bestiolae CBS 10118]